MLTIKPFIDLGWFTVPLKGELKRDDKGKKTIPVFPKDFKDHYSKIFNREETELGGVITGPSSKIIAIDCDNTLTYNVFKALDPGYDCHFVSKGKLDSNGKPMDGGTIIYEYTPELEESFSVHNDRFNLDFYSTNGFVYLPTSRNKTKVPWTDLKEVKPAPAAILALIKSLKPVKLRAAELELGNKQYTVHLCPQVTQFVATKKVTRQLFKILTPKDFRATQDYLDNGFCHPHNIVDGRGSEYLSKVSAILGADESIDEELYSKAMEAINNLFADPMPKKRLQQTIIEPMIEEKASVGDQVIWRYNKDWEAGTTIVVTKLNSSLHVFFDMIRKNYYAVDIFNEQVHEFARDVNLYSFLETVAVETASKKELKTLMPLVNVVSTPQYPFGFFGENKSSFNRFAPTQALQIFKDPDVYSKNYAYPKHLIAFFESLIPDDYMRNYMFRFLRRKFDLFEYSPVVLYLLGASGSGKDLFVSLLAMILGEASIAKPSASEFIENHNGWIMDKYFAHLDEYGDQLSRYNDQEVAKGKIKAWSGKSNISLRMMGNDGFNYEHNVTFVLTANKNPLTFDDDDRRIALFNTPTKLKFAPLAQEMGLPAFVEALRTEINDFMYWLATTKENATLEEFMDPPETEDKQRLIAEKLSAGSQIAYYLKNGLFDELEKLATMHSCESLFNSATDDRLYEDDLFDLYMELTDDQGTKRGLTMAMQQFDKIPTTRAGKKAYVYRIPGLRTTSKQVFTPIKGDV